MLHASFVRSPFARAPNPGHRHHRGAGRARGARGVHRRRPQPRTPRSSGTRRSVAASPETPASPAGRRRGALRRRPGRAGRRREPLRRRGRGRAGRRRLRAAGRRSSTTATAESTEALVHEAHGSNLIGEIGGLPASALDDVFAAAAHVASETIFQQAYAPVPMEGRGLVVDHSRATGDLTIYSATQSPHEVRLFCSRLLGIPEHRIRVVMRDTGGGFGQKIMVQRDEMCLMLAAPKLGRPGEVGRGPAREPPRRRAVPPRARRRAHGVRRRRRDPGRRHRLRGRLRRLPDPLAGRSPARRSACCSPARTASPPPASAPRRCTRTPSAAPPTAARGSSSRSPARCCSTSPPAQMGMDPVELRRRNLLHRDELPYANPNGMTYDSISPLETFEQALAMLDYDAFRAEQAEARTRGRYLGVGMLELRRAVDAGVRRVRDRGGDDPHRALGRGQRVRRRAAPPGTASRRRSCRSPPTRSASTSTTSPPSRATPRSPASGPGPPGAGADR